MNEVHYLLKTLKGILCKNKKAEPFIDMLTSVTLDCQVKRQIKGSPRSRGAWWFHQSCGENNGIWEKMTSSAKPVV